MKDLLLDMLLLEASEDIKKIANIKSQKKSELLAASDEYRQALQGGKKGKKQQAARKLDKLRKEYEEIAPADAATLKIEEPDPQFLAQPEQEKQKQKTKSQELRARPEKNLKSTNKQWVPWSPEAKKIYKLSAEESKKNYGGVFGPGETSVLITYGGTLMGHSQDFDLLHGNQKWEIKEVDSGRLRTSVHGIITSAEPRHRLNTVFKKLSSAIQKLNSDSNVVDLLSTSRQRALAALTKFIDSQMESIFSKSEITVNKMAQITGALENAANVLSGLEAIADASDSFNSVTVGSETFQVRGAQFQKILAALGKDDDIDVGTTSATARRAARYANMMDDEALRNPDDFMESQISEMDPKKTFHNVDGVILVTPESHMVLTGSELDDMLDFDGLTQGGRSFYRLKNK